MGGEDSRAEEEDSAFLSLIMSNVIWREKQEVGLATHISLAELQRRGMMQREGTPHPVSPTQPACPYGAFGWASCWYPNDSHLAKQGLPRGEAVASILGGVAAVDMKRLQQRWEASLQP